MKKTVKIKGIGKITVKPDFVELFLKLNTKEKEYNKAIEMEAENLHELTEEIYSLGFGKDDLKTSDFQVRTVNKNIKDKDGNFHSNFDGFEVTHVLVLRFDLNQDKLNSIINLAAKSKSQPAISISFTVKDPSQVKKDLMTEIAKDAKEKAELLCQGAGADLDKLYVVEYDWQNLELVSKIDLPSSEPSADGMSGLNITPDDITASDTATFVWEIK